MITIRKNSERGSTVTSWLDSRHTFSFGSYYDTRNMGFGDLRVINEDRVSPAAGFPPHSHQHMEIISYVLEGALQHKDSIGTGSIIRPGEVQLMSAGFGITHSEFNPSADQPTHFLQIWIKPNQTNLEPSYQQKNFQHQLKAGQMVLLVSPDGVEDSLIIHQDVKIYLLNLDRDQTTSISLENNRMIWVQVVSGEMKVNDNVLQQGDGAGIQLENKLQVSALQPSEMLIFDLSKK